MLRARTRHNRSRIFLVVAALSATASPAAVASASGGDDGGDIVIESAGDQTNAITLPAPAEVGQTGQTTLALNMDLAVDGGGMSTSVAVGLEMTLTSEVTEVKADGGYVALSSLDEVAVTELPEGTNEADIPCIGVTGVQLEQTFDAGGNTVSMEPVGSATDVAEAACVEQLSSTQSQTTLVYPAEPIGPGASWSADIVTGNQGIEVPVTYHYTLTDVTDGRYTIETTLDSDFEVEQDGLVGTGTMSGSGTSTGSVANPLDASSSFDVVMDMVSDIAGQQMTMSVEMDIDIVAAVPAS